MLEREKGTSRLMRRRWYAQELKAEAGIMREWCRRAAQVGRKLAIGEIVLYQLLDRQP